MRLLKMWTLRILFFPLWIFFLHRRHKRDQARIREHRIEQKPEPEPEPGQDDLAYQIWKLKYRVTPEPAVIVSCAECNAGCDKCDPEREIHFWFDKPITSLDDGHLFNIIEAMGRGHWLKTGNPVQILPKLRIALRKEATKRGWGNAKIVAFRQRNSRHEKALQKRTYNVRSNYPIFVEKPTGFLNEELSDKFPPTVIKQ